MKMSALVTHSATFNTLHHVQEFIARLLHLPSKPTDPLAALRALPDHMLLDIGVDPRTVECHSVSLIGDVDTVAGRHLATLTRTAAKS